MPNADLALRFNRDPISRKNVCQYGLCLPGSHGSESYSLRANTPLSLLGRKPLNRSGCPMVPQYHTQFRI
jgi:hypothetical protein